MGVVEVVSVANPKPSKNPLVRMTEVLKDKLLEKAGYTKEDLDISKEVQGGIGYLVKLPSVEMETYEEILKPKKQANEELETYSEERRVSGTIGIGALIGEIEKLTIQILKNSGRQASVRLSNEEVAEYLTRIIEAGEVLGLPVREMLEKEIEQRRENEKEDGR